MDRERHGGWVSIMANRYRGIIYVGVTSDLAARITQHRNGRARSSVLATTLRDWCGLNSLNQSMKR